MVLVSSAWTPLQDTAQSRGDHGDGKYASVPHSNTFTKVEPYDFTFQIDLERPECVSLGWNVAPPGIAIIL